MPEYSSIPFYVMPVVAFALVILCVMPLRKLARLAGVMDKPGGRKQHDKAIPPIGGLVLFSVFMICGVLFDLVDLRTFWPLYVGLIVLMVSGAIDDQFHIHAWVKFVLHVFAAGLIVFMGQVRAAYMGDIFGMGTLWMGFMTYPFTITAIVLLINAMNLLDGMDGLAGGVSVVMFGWMAVASFAAGWFGQAHILTVLIACLVGFLWFNMRNPWRRKASLFLGDAGSMSLGLAIAWFAVHLARGPYTPLEPITVAWIIGFPIFDTCAQFYRRVREGKHPFEPDRGHFHHHFIDAGVPVHIAAPVIIGLVAIMGGIGYGGIAIGLPPVVLTVLWIALLFIHIAMSRDPVRYVTLIQRCAKLMSRASRSADIVAQTNQKG